MNFDFMKKLKLETIIAYRNKLSDFLLKIIKDNNVFVTILVLLYIGFYYNRAKFRIAEEEKKTIIADTTMNDEAIFLDTALYNKTLEQKKEYLLSNFDNDHIIGNINAPVKMIDYSSFSCKYCQQMRADINKIIQEYAISSDKLLYVFRPVVNKKTMALKILLNCVDDEKKVWEMVHEMFSIDWNKIEDEKFVLNNLIKKYNIATKRHNECLSGSTEYRKILYYQKENSQFFNLKRTPLLVINGVKYSGYKNYDELKKIIEENVKKN
jgi:protein-disulfide isomerase